MKASSYKRILAYFIDILIIAFISSILTMAIPHSQNYKNLSNDLTEIMEKYTDGKLETNEYLEQVNDISYSLNKEGVVESIVSVVISLIYFVLGSYYGNGQTLGKKIMKLQVVSVSKNKELTFNNYLIRSLIIDSILLNIISIILILFLNKSLYLTVYDITSSIFTLIYIATFIMILFRQDRRGLHDLLAKTKVISVENKSISDNNI